MSQIPTANETVHFRPPRVRRRRQRGTAILLNLAPMIDVTFLLLIFFLVTTTFREAEGYFRSQLPRDSGASGSTLPISPVVVRLAPGDPEGITCAIRVDNVAHPPADFDALAAMLLDLQNRPGFDNETPVVIMANDDLPWNHVVDGWNAAVRANCKSIMFGG